MNRLLFYLVRLARIYILIVVLAMGCMFLGIMMGDGDMPPFYDVPVAEIADPINQNTTAHLSNSKIPHNSQERWFALYHTLRILETVNPQVRLWVDRMQQNNLIVYDFDVPFDHPDYGTRYAFQSIFTGHLMLSPQFWTLDDIEKASIFVHEYRHSRQNPIKVMGFRALQVISLRAFSNPNAIGLEDEAYRYQYRFYKAIGLEKPSLRSWLEERGKLNNTRD